MIVWSVVIGMLSSSAVLVRGEFGLLSTLLMMFGFSSIDSGLC
jgi:hypothetical protein